MKTRLLSKVRKRYEIVKITKLGKGSRATHLVLSEIVGLPIFELRDRECNNRYYPSNDYNDVLDKLIVWIRLDYGNGIKRENSQKVWYGNKNS